MANEKNCLDLNRQAAMRGFAVTPSFEETGHECKRLLYASCLQAQFASGRHMAV
jgi:hypothetical protein